ncbi:hypothetical protein LMG19282_02025 [Cupriavidus campinensis]|nr:hypothetical protein LMG19282_02025 [Cupriavidus campinensis]
MALLLLSLRCDLVSCPERMSTRPCLAEMAMSFSAATPLPAIRTSPLRLVIVTESPVIVLAFCWLADNSPLALAFWLPYGTTVTPLLFAPPLMLRPMSPSVAPAVLIFQPLLWEEEDSLYVSVDASMFTLRCASSTALPPALTMLPCSRMSPSTALPASSFTPLPVARRMMSPAPVSVLPLLVTPSE